MQTLGRRERNKAEKRDRIVSAASRLFAQHGFAATTTQQVAADADVADGTLFRYAPTKIELLLMVTNERLAPLLDAGRQAAQARRSHSRGSSRGAPPPFRQCLHRGSPSYLRTRGSRKR